MPCGEGAPLGMLRGGHFRKLCHTRRPGKPSPHLLSSHLWINVSHPPPPSPPSKQSNAGVAPPFPHRKKKGPRSQAQALHSFTTDNEPLTTDYSTFETSIHFLPSFSLTTPVTVTFSFDP